ncbi:MULTISPECIES: hypothetical protein [Amycolatopsis]|uniref:Transposase n=1 Tax=Amycolatopsis albidoflavus TaxID=102226 RepID=A0ABW5HXM7_9PSEU
MLATPESLMKVYREDLHQPRRLISDGEPAHDAIAVSRRRYRLKMFHRPLDDPHFDFETV